MDIFDPEAFRDAEGKVVPLVIYQDGQRLVVGEASIHVEDGLKIDARVAPEHEMLLSVVEQSPMGLSIGRREP